MGMRVAVVHLLISLLTHWMSENMAELVLADITAGALCPAANSCPEAIYLTGLHQTVIGLFSILTNPIVGQLADDYGCKPILLIGVAAYIPPFAILAWNQTSRSFVYAYLIISTLSFTISESNMHSLSFSFVAGMAEGSKRSTAFGQIAGVFAAAKVASSALSLLLPLGWNFKASLLLAIFSTIYMKVFLKEVVAAEHGHRGLLDADAEAIDEHACGARSSASKQQQHIPINWRRILEKRWKSMKETAVLVSRSETLRRASCTIFFYRLGYSGIFTVMMLYQKSVFGFNKNQFSQIQLMVNLGSIFFQVLMLPLMLRFLKEKGVLCIALVACIVYAWLNGLAWAPWVMYFSALFGAIYGVEVPASRAIFSSAVTAGDQGKTHGVVSCLISLSKMLSPLVMSPLTSLFISSEAPFNCKGFSILLASVSLMVALVHALRIRQGGEAPNSPEDSCLPEEEAIAAPLLSTPDNAIVVHL